MCELPAGWLVGEGCWLRTAVLGQKPAMAPHCCRSMHQLSTALLRTLNPHYKSLLLCFLAARDSCSEQQPPCLVHWDKEMYNRTVILHDSAEKTQVKQKPPHNNRSCLLTIHLHMWLWFCVIFCDSEELKQAQRKRKPVERFIFSSCRKTSAFVKVCLYRLHILWTVKLSCGLQSDTLTI